MKRISAAYVFLLVAFLPSCFAARDCYELKQSGVVGQVLIALSGAFASGAAPGETNFSCNTAQTPDDLVPSPHEQAIGSDGGPACPLAVDGADACSRCILGACCELVVACAGDAACACHAQCAANGESCADCGDSTVFDEAQACTREHCNDQCPNAR